MPTKNKLIYIAAVLLLATAMLVMPAAAGRDGPVIHNGDTVFVYEENLDFTDVFNFPNSGDKLKYYSGEIEGHRADIILTVDVNNMTDLRAIKVRGKYGTYYASFMNGTPNTAHYVQVKEPRIDNFDLQSFYSKNSVDGKKITRITDLMFVIRSNIGAVFCEGAGYAPANMGYIRITTPKGGKLTIVNDADFDRVYLDAAKVETTGGADHFNFEGMDPGTYTAQFRFGSCSDFYDNGFNSELVIFTVRSQDLTIECGKDSIVRNNPFVIYVSGDSKSLYTLYIKEASTATARMPYIQEGQSGVSHFSGTKYPDASDVICNVTMKADGTRPVQFDTNEATRARTYTIKVVDPYCIDTYDTVQVKVEKGEVTVTAPGDHSYCIGTEIALSGTNTDSDSVYLFVTSPNLAEDGAKLTDTACDATTGNPCTFDRVAVKTDNTWKFNWQTDSSLDAGSYTIYTVSAPYNKHDLSDAEYDFVSISLRKPFVTATASAYVAKGDSLHITGIAGGEPDEVMIWVFGRNYVGPACDRPAFESVEDDGSFDYEFDYYTKDLSNGQYFVVVQHPSGDNIFDVFADSCNINGAKSTTGEYMGVFNRNHVQAQFLLTGANRLQGSEAAQALITILEKANIDDTCQGLQFYVVEPVTNIDPIGDRHVGDVFNITGTTNLAVGDELIVDIRSTSFDPTNRTQNADDFSSSFGTIAVTEGAGDLNVWSFNADISEYIPDRYIVKVESIKPGTFAIATFDVLEGVVDPTPVGSIQLSSGWNFVSTPKTLASGSNTAAIFANIDTAGHQILTYNADSNIWSAMGSEDVFSPLDGVWIYSNGTANAKLRFSNDIFSIPPTKQLYPGWNAIGFSDTTSASANNALTSVEDSWKILIGLDADSQAYETSIINGADGIHSESRLMVPTKGYWLYMGEPGQLASISG